MDDDDADRRRLEVLVLARAVQLGVAMGLSGRDADDAQRLFEVARRDPVLLDLFDAVDACCPRLPATRH